MSLTVAKNRRAASAVPRGIGVTPNAAQDAEWRRQVAGSYTGFEEQEDDTVNLLSGLQLLAELDGDLTDTSVNARHGTAFGAPTYVTGLMGEALRCTQSSSQYATFPDIPIDGVSQLSMSLWYYPRSLGGANAYTAIASNHTTGDINNRTMVSQGGTGAGSSASALVMLNNGSATYGYTGSIFVVNTRIHLVVVYDGSYTNGNAALQNAGRLKIYANGVDQTLTFSGNIPASLCNSPLNPLMLGRWESSYSDADFDQFAVWDRPLNSNEAAYLFNGGSGRPGFAEAANRRFATVRTTPRFSPRFSPRIM